MGSCFFASSLTLDTLPPAPLQLFRPGARPQLKLVCHFSVKQKSGRKKKLRDDEEPKKSDAQSAKGRNGQGSVPAAGSGSASAAAKSKTKMEGGRAAAGAGAAGLWMTKGDGGDFAVKCGCVARVLFLALPPCEGVVWCVVSAR